MVTTLAGQKSSRVQTTNPDILSWLLIMSVNKLYQGSGTTDRAHVDLTGTTDVFEQPIVLSA